MTWLSTISSTCSPSWGCPEKSGRSEIAKFSSELGSTCWSEERKNVKASVRKQVQEMLAKLQGDPEVEKLQQEFNRKGFLSKRELKALLSLHPKTNAA